MKEITKKKRGRPPISAESMTAAERKRRQLTKLKEAGSIMIQIVLTKSVIEIVDCYIGTEDGQTRSQVVQSWLEDWAVSAALDSESKHGRTIANKIIKESKDLNSIQELK